MKDASVNGIIDSDTIHIEDVLRTREGDMKFYPLAGVGIQQYSKGRSTAALQLKIKQQLEKDSAKEVQISYENEALNVYAIY